MLKNRGRFAMVHRAERMAEVLSTMRKKKVEPKRLRMVYSKPNTDAVLFLVEGVKNASKNMVVEKPLIIRNEDTSYTDEIFEIYNMGN